MTPRRVDDDDPASRAENESERFLLVHGGEIPTPEEARAVFATSLLEAWMSSEGGDPTAGHPARGRNQDGRGRCDGQVTRSTRRRRDGDERCGSYV